MGCAWPYQLYNIYGRLIGWFSCRRSERCRVRREPRRDGGGQRYRDVLHVRAPSGAFHRQGLHRLHPQQQSAGTLQTGQVPYFATKYHY